MDTNIAWSGFYKKSVEERRQQLQWTYPDLLGSSDPLALNETPSPLLSRVDLDSADIGQEAPMEYQLRYNDRLMSGGGTPKAQGWMDGLDVSIADNMIENCIGWVKTEVDRCSIFNGIRL
jgi:hypothetical protein